MFCLKWTYLQVKGVEEVKDEESEDVENKESWNCCYEEVSGYKTVLCT